MKGLVKRIKRFISDDEGMETLEVAAIALGAVLLIGIVVTIYNAARDYVQDASNEMVNLEKPGGD